MANLGFTDQRLAFLGMADGYGCIGLFGLVHVLIASCQLWVWCVQSSDGEALTQPYLYVATAPDSPPDLREEPGLGFRYGRTN